MTYRRLFYLWLDRSHRPVQTIDRQFQFAYHLLFLFWEGSRSDRKLFAVLNKNSVLGKFNQQKFILFRGYRAISWFYWINSKDFINYVLKSTIKATSVPKDLKTILTVTAMRLKWNITEFTFNAGGEILQRQKRLKHQTTGEILRGIERNFPATVFLASPLLHPKSHNSDYRNAYQ